MRIIVTGSSGFIGSHLVDRLISEHGVTGVDRKRSEYTTAVLDCRDLAQAVASDNRIRPGRIFEIPKWEFCYHLASTMGVSNVLNDPQACIDNIINSTRAVLRLGIPGIYFSTSEVYGRNTDVLSEDSGVILSSKSRWSYAAAKLCGEWMALQAGWKVVRLFNVAGPRQSEESGAVLPRFVKQALSGEPITVYGEGTQIRTFIDVHDCVEILDKLRTVDFDVVNVAGPHLMTMLTLAKEVRTVLDSPSPIEQVPYEQAYPKGFEECQSRIPDHTKLKSLIGPFKYRPLNQTIKELAQCIATKNPKCLTAPALNSWTHQPAG